MIVHKILDNILKFSLYKHCVNDILTLPEEEHFTPLTKTLNSIYPNLSVSHKEEKDNRLPFVDILLTSRPDGTLQRDIYREATWDERCSQLSSFAPVTYKRGLVQTLFYRV